MPVGNDPDHRLDRGDAGPLPLLKKENRPSIHRAWGGGRSGSNFVWGKVLARKQCQNAFEQSTPIKRGEKRKR